MAATDLTYISIWDLQTGALIGSTSSPDKMGLSSFLAFDLDSCIILTGKASSSGGSREPSFLLWNPYTVQHLGYLDYQRDGYGLCGAFNPDRKTFIGAAGNVISVWNLHNKANLLYQPEDWEIREILASRGYTGHHPQTTCLAFSTNGHIFVSGGTYGDIVIWDAHTMQAFRTITGHKGAIRSLIVSSDDSIVTSGSDDKTIKVWSLHSGKLLRTLESHKKPIQFLLLSSDGQTLLSAGQDNTIGFWNLHHEAPLRMIELPQEKQPSIISTATVTLDGKLLIASIDDKTVKIWGNK